VVADRGGGGGGDLAESAVVSGSQWQWSLLAALVAIQFDPAPWWW